ncbi:MAG: hypothetical protein HYT94_00465 [Parcubacteria group bacterium]|nr:hypothetical protein [Parcubacteria group bacterium]
MTAQKKTSGVGAGLPLAAGVIAGIAGTYFLYGKNATANRKKLKGWIVKAKGEAIEKIEKMKEMDEASYHALIDGVVQKYSKVKGVEQAEVDELVKDLKKHWKNIMKDAAPKPKKKKASAKKAKASVSE